MDYSNMKPACLKVLNEVEHRVAFSDLDITFHYNEERMSRHERIMENIGDGNYLTSFIVDKAHPNGNEIHSIYDNGIVLIQNERTGKVITELIARPHQLRRYWEGQKEPAYLNGLCRKAFNHMQKGWNNW